MTLSSKNIGVIDISNNFIMWAGFGLSWISLIFMRREDVKRLMPVAQFSIVTSILIHDIGITFGLWSVQQSIFPLYSVLPYLIGLLPILTIWVFYFTYGRFWLYMATNMVLDLGFNFYFLSNFLPSRGILGYHTIPFLSLPITLTHAVILYRYQMWQEDALVPIKKKRFTSNPAPLLAKPMPEEEDSTKK